MEGGGGDLTVVFESESVYVFEVTGRNDGGVEDNENPKLLRGLPYSLRWILMIRL